MKNNRGKVKGMKRIKQVNIIFLVIVLLPYLVLTILPKRLFEGQLSTLLISQALYAVPAIIYIIMSQLSVREAIRVHKIRWKTVLLTLLFSFTITPVMGYISAVSQLFAKNEIGSTITSIASEFPFWVSITCIALIPAILEETVYRGVFFCEYSKLNKRAAIFFKVCSFLLTHEPPTKNVAFVSAFLFAALHQNLNQFSYALVMGIIFTLLIEATDSILSSMILHFCINGSSVLMIYLYQGILDAFHITSEQVGGAEQLVSELGAVTTDKVAIAQAVEMYTVPAIIGCILSYLVFRAIAMSEGRWETVRDIFSDKKESKVPWYQLITIPLIIGIGWCILNIIVLLFQQ